MCRFRYAITETDTKVLAAVAELIPAVKGKSESVVLKYLAEKHENNQGLIQIPLQFPSSIINSTIEFYDIDLERLVVVAKYKLPKKDCFSLRGPGELTDVTHLLDAIEQLDEDFREKIELSRYGETTVVTKDQIEDLVSLANDTVAEHKQKIHEIKTMDISMVLQEYENDQEKAISNIEERLTGVISEKNSTINGLRLQIQDLSDENEVLSRKYDDINTEVSKLREAASKEREGRARVNSPTPKESSSMEKLRRKLSPQKMINKAKQGFSQIQIGGGKPETEDLGRAPTRPPHPPMSKVDSREFKPPPIKQPGVGASSASDTKVNDKVPAAPRDRYNIRDEQIKETAEVIKQMNLLSEAKNRAQERNKKVEERLELLEMNEQGTMGSRGQRNQAEYRDVYPNAHVRAENDPPGNQFQQETRPGGYGNYPRRQDFTENFAAPYSQGYAPQRQYQAERNHFDPGNYRRQDDSRDLRRDECNFGFRGQEE
jgi:hypothetical protein